MPITGDSTEYKILKEACDRVKGDNLLTCEIGVREGLGSKIILESFKNKTHWHIGIDPYGNISYKHYDHPPIVKKDGALIDGVRQKAGTKLPLSFRANYTNQMKAELLKNLDFPNFTLYQLEDTEFFKRFADGVPIYRNVKSLMTKYDLVHFDGPHRSLDIVTEVIFFASRASDNCVFVFDDYPQYNMSLIGHMLIHYYNFKQVNRGEKKIVFQNHG